MAVTDWRYGGTIGSGIENSSNVINPNPAIYGRWRGVGEENTPALPVTNYGFSVPLDAAVTGVEINVVGSRVSSANMTIRVVQAYLLPGSLSSPNLGIGVNFTVWPETSTTTYGGPSNAFGLTLTPAIVNSSDFGFRIIVHKGSTLDSEIRVHLMSMRIYYEEPGNFFERVAATWRKGQLSERVAGVYRPGKLYERIGGIWRS
jgi:hypothetical protein